MPYKDKAKQKESSKRHYERNTALIKQRARDFNQKVRGRNFDIIKSIKEQGGCHRCKNRDHRVLDFHHLRDKTANIADVAALCWSEKRLLEEIEKCEILCANCHRIETYEQRRLLRDWSIS